MIDLAPFLFAIIYFYSLISSMSVKFTPNEVKTAFNEPYELKVLNKKNNPFVWIYGIFKLQHLRKI